MFLKKKEEVCLINCLKAVKEHQPDCLMVGQGHTDVYILDNSTRISFEYRGEIQNRVSDPALVLWSQILKPS